MAPPSLVGFFCPLSLSCLDHKGKEERMNSNDFRRPGSVMSGPNQTWHEVRTLALKQVCSELNMTLPERLIFWHGGGKDKLSRDQLILNATRVNSVSGVPSRLPSRLPSRRTWQATDGSSLNQMEQTKRRAGETRH